jgi:hypothetical protein
MMHRSSASSLGSWSSVPTVGWRVCGQRARSAILHCPVFRRRGGEAGICADYAYEGRAQFIGETGAAERFATNDRWHAAMFQL